MLELILAISVSFACGYGVRARMSRRRRKEARKRYYERHSALKLDAHAPKAESMTGATGKKPTIWELDERLSRPEDRIFGTTLGDEARSEFVATRPLSERKSEEHEHSNNGGGVLTSQMMGQRPPWSD